MPRTWQGAERSPVRPGFERYAGSNLEPARPAVLFIQKYSLVSDFVRDCSGVTCCIDML